nr:ABC transporter ATP-binding protein [Enterovibrio nigricans]
MRKTSTLRMIAGFEAATTGSITLAGREIQTLPPAQRGVAMAFEGYSLYPPLSVQDNIGFALKSSGLSREAINQRINELATLLAIEDILDAYPSSLSGGQQQRVSLARALARDADLFLLDEPMGQLEPRLRTLLRGHIKHYLKSRGLTAILVTHDQTEANALADRIAVMEGGELMQYATPATLKASPANRFVGTFIGEPPMNLLPVFVKNDGDSLLIDLGRSGGVYTIQCDKANFTPALCEYLCQRGELMMGFRPYAVQLTDTGLSGRVLANQWLGDQTHFSIRIAEHSLIAISHERSPLRPGDDARVQIDQRQLHFFDPLSGSRLTESSCSASSHHSGRA